MGHTTAVEPGSGRKYYLDDPDDLGPDEPVTFLLNLHGGGSVGAWQRSYFPAQDYKNQHRLVVATPSCATKEPMRRWVGEADDAHLRGIVRQVFDTYGARRIRSFWLVGHSQGGMTSNRLLRDDTFFQDRVDGWLSLSGGRFGPIELPESFFAPHGQRPRMPEGSPRPGQGVPPDADFSFIFATGEHEMLALPETSPWADKYGAGPRERRPDIFDTEPGQIHDTRFGAEGGPKSTAAWGLLPGPGTAQMWVYPGAKDGRVIADVVRLNKGHTEGLEPHVTEELIRLLVSAPGGKVQTAEAATAA
jgi:pimeloyl-ACP methyl ester carboxylesterase